MPVAVSMYMYSMPCITRTEEEPSPLPLTLPAILPAHRLLLLLLKHLGQALNVPIPTPLPHTPPPFHHHGIDIFPPFWEEELVHERRHSLGVLHLPAHCMPCMLIIYLIKRHHAHASRLSLPPSPSLSRIKHGRQGTLGRWRTDGRTAWRLELGILVIPKPPLTLQPLAHLHLLAWLCSVVHCCHLVSLVRHPSPNLP